MSTILEAFKSADELKDFLQQELYPNTEPLEVQLSWLENKSRQLRKEVRSHAL
jgi:hypothetical protein